MQDGFTLSISASQGGHTQTLALLLANKANIGAANKVQQLYYSVAYYSFTTSCKVSLFLFYIISDFSILKHAYLLNMVHLCFCIQDGNAPAIVASQYGHTETLALLLANKADVNSANKEIV
jgi:ankyrin repeat protein